MKIIKACVLFLFTAALTLSSASCKQGKSPTMDTMPFTAEAMGKYLYDGPDSIPNPKCFGEMTAFRVVVDGIGKGSPVGEFRVHFDFCGDSALHYGNSEAYLIDSDGDSLLFSVSGQVIPGRLASHPEFVTSYWKDRYEILGGSGKFEHASGYFLSDDYNSSQDLFSHHHWDGIITMKEIE